MLTVRRLTFAVGIQIRSESKKTAIFLELEVPQGV